MQNRADRVGDPSIVCVASCVLRPASCSLVGLFPGGGVVRPNIPMNRYRITCPLSAHGAYPSADHAPAPPKCSRQRRHHDPRGRRYAMMAAEPGAPTTCRGLDCNPFSIPRLTFTLTRLESHADAETALAADFEPLVAIKSTNSLPRRHDCAFEASFCTPQPKVAAIRATRLSTYSSRVIWPCVCGSWLLKGS